MCFMQYLLVYRSNLNIWHHAIFGTFLCHKMISCLSEVQIYLGVMDFYLLNLATVHCRLQ